MYVYVVLNVNTKYEIVAWKRLFPCNMFPDCYVIYEKLKNFRFNDVVSAFMRLKFFEFILSNKFFLQFHA